MQNITPTEWCAMTRQEQNKVLIEALSSCSTNDCTELLENPADNAFLFGICAESLRAPKSRDYYLSQYNEIEDLTSIESSIIISRFKAAIKESV